MVIFVAENELQSHRMSIEASVGSFRSKSCKVSPSGVSINVAMPFLSWPGVTLAYFSTLISMTCSIKRSISLTRSYWVYCSAELK